jgi:UDP-glucose 4-epimerase
MVRVIPLFIHSMLRGEPITIYGGNDKTLDFTYVDDCIDGIVAGIEALGERLVVNQTINLAYGQGNTLVRCAELIAGELGTAPDMTLAPSLLGEVTHYVADLSKARELLGYTPKVSLDDGIARAVAWFREHRAAHPEEDVPVLADHEGTSRETGPVWKTAAAT